MVAPSVDRASRSRPRPVEVRARRDIDGGKERKRRVPVFRSPQQSPVEKQVCWTIAPVSRGLVNIGYIKLGRPSAARPCGSLLFRLLEPQFPTIVSLVLMLVLLPLLLDALDSYLENRQSKLGAMKELVVADPTTPPAAESSVRKEAEKIVETAAEEVKPVAEAAPKKKKGSPFKGGKKKEAGGAPEASRGGAPRRPLPD